MSRVVVLGGGVNELVAAHLLARAHHEVTLISASASPAPDQFESGWLPPAVARDLEIKRYGRRIEEPDPWALVPLPDGGRLELGRDIAETAKAIGRLNARDGARWGDFCARMHVLAALLEKLYGAPPPDPASRSLRGTLALARTALNVRELGRKGMEDLLRLLPMSAADWLDEWFECDALKGALGAAAVMHLAQGPRSGGTAFNLLHHHVGSAPGVFRPPLTNVRSTLSRRSEVEVRTAAVARIDVHAGRAGGVTLEDGESIPAAAVVSGLPPSQTLLELVDPGWLDPQLVRALRNVRSRGVVAKLALTLDREPAFTTLVVAPSLDYLERAYDASKYGRISAAPYIEALYTPTLSLPRQGGGQLEKRHRVAVRVQYVPHALKDGVWDTALADTLARNIVARISESVPGFADAVIERRIHTPDDLEHIDGLPQGQEYHAELALDQILWMRPVPQLADYRTPIGGLYLCGPAMHPGIPGATGANAAGAVLREIKR